MLQVQLLKFIINEKITKIYEKLDNNNDLCKECPRCNGKGIVPNSLEWDNNEKLWTYIDKYEYQGLNGKYYYNYIFNECPLCKGKKNIDITKYRRCPDCKEKCGYGNRSLFGNKVKFCKSCNGSGYFIIE